MITVSARVQYACLAVLELAKRTGSTRPTRIDEIAAEQHIPKQFLVHILLQLKREGILASTRGVGGGYALARSPATITVGQVVRALEPTLSTPETKLNNSGSRHLSDSVLLALWKDVESRANEVLDAVTFEQLLRKTSEASEYAI